MYYLIIFIAFYFLNLYSLHCLLNTTYVNIGLSGSDAGGVHRLVGDSMLLCTFNDILYDCSGCGARGGSEFPHPAEVLSS